MSQFHQLTLPVELNSESTFDNFFFGDNAPVINQLKHFDQQSVIYLGGPSGSGLTHLLHAMCHQAIQRQNSAMYIAAQSLHDYAPDVFDGLEHCYLLCIDNVEWLAGNKVWEEALFHLYNRCHSSSNHLVLSGHGAPPQLGIQLPDLLSRLQAGLVLNLRSLSDEQKLAALVLRAKHLGFHLPTEVGHFLLARCTRNMQSLAEILTQLASATLAAQRRLTVPFVKQVLGL